MLEKSEGEIKKLMYLPETPTKHSALRVICKTKWRKRQCTIQRYGQHWTQNTEQNPDIALYHIEIILLYYIY